MVKRKSGGMMIIKDFRGIQKYGIVYTDPPWPQNKTIRKCRPNQRKELDYQTLSLDKIKSIHKDAFGLLEDKANVFMWTIDKFLIDTERIMNELGFTVHARIIWNKGNGVAAAYTVRFSHEYLIWFYKKGHILMPTKECRGKYTTVINANSKSHSRKPLCVYDILEDMFPSAKKLEMFARNQKNGWDCWGDQPDYFETILF